MTNSLLADEPNLLPDPKLTALEQLALFIGNSPFASMESFQQNGQPANTVGHQNNSRRQSMNITNIGSLTEHAAVRQLTLGETTFTYIVDGAMSMSATHFLPGIADTDPKNYERYVAQNDQIPMSTGALLIDDRKTRILIDTGLGPTRAEATLGRSNSGSLLDVLDHIGISPTSIDIVAFTHLHGDHTGWATRTNENDSWSKTFPNARYLISTPEWEAARLSEQQSASAQTDPFEVASRLNDIDSLTLIDDNETISSGVRAIVTPGHSPGHTTYIVTTSSGERLIAFGDTFHSPLQINEVTLISAPDNAPGHVPAARNRIIHELDKPETIGFGIHFGDQPFGRLASDRSSWIPIPSKVLLPTPRRC